MAWMKPSPSLPRRASAPTRQSSKTSEAVSETRMPTLSSCFPTETPGVVERDEEGGDAVVVRAGFASGP